MTRRTPEPAAGFEAALGYQFGDPALRTLALTPPSSGRAEHNQRLEFLGDALLNACTALLLFREQPDWSEGALSKLRSYLVGTDSLHAWAEDLGLELIPGPRTPLRGPGGAERRKALADAVEALLAAAFLDAGAGDDGFRAVLAVVEKRLLEAIQAANPGDWQGRDFKTALQERAAALGLPAPHYALTGKHGPEHSPSFTVTVRVGEREATATAGTRKKAETLAAGRILGELGPDSSPGTAR